MKKIIIASFVLLFATNIFAQEAPKVNNGNHTVSLGGVFSTFMNWRDYPSGFAAPKLEKNTIKIKDARFVVDGKVGDDYEYKLAIDFAAIGSSVIDPAAPPMYDAYFAYKGFKKFAKITVGYMKIPYSHASDIEHELSPFWSRATIAKGDCFSRRDVGVKLSRSFWKNRINAFAGIYTGVGEVVLTGTNDPSGSYEYVSRVEFSYPDKMPKEFADTKVRTTPNFSLGINGRYSKRNLPTGTTFLAGEVGALLNDTTLNFKVVNGEKFVYGSDFSVEYMGFSAQFEGHIIKGIPQNANDPLLLGLPQTLKKGYFKAGGWFGQLNYYSKKIKTIFSARYDEMNANDLLTGKAKSLATSICYQLNGYHSMIRAEFYRNLSQTESINTNKWNNEWRIGWQLQIQ